MKVCLEFVGMLCKIFSLKVCFLLLSNVSIVYHHGLRLNKKHYILKTWNQLTEPNLSLSFDFRTVFVVEHLKPVKFVLICDCVTQCVKIYNLQAENT